MHTLHSHSILVSGELRWSFHVRIVIYSNRIVINSKISKIHRPYYYAAITFSPAECWSSLKKPRLIGHIILFSRDEMYWIVFWPQGTVTLFASHCVQGRNHWHLSARATVTGIMIVLPLMPSQWLCCSLLMALSPTLLLSQSKMLS